MYPRLFSRSGLSLERLRTFLEVTEAGSMAKAADGDVVRQSQFSRQIKELEEHFQRKFTERSGRNVILNAEGREFAALVRQIMGSLEAWHSTEGQTTEESVILGGGDSFLRGVVIPRLALVRERLPNTVLELRNLRSTEIAEGLDDGRLDLGIIEESDRRAGLGGIKLGRIGYQLLCFDPQADLTSWQAALALPFVALEGARHLEAAMGELATKAGIRIAPAVRCASWHAVADCLPVLRGCALVPSIVTPPAGCRVLPTPKLKLPQRSLWLAWNERRGDLRKNSARWRGVLGDVMRLQH